MRTDQTERKHHCHNLRTDQTQGKYDLYNIENRSNGGVDSFGPPQKKKKKKEIKTFQGEN